MSLLERVPGHLLKIQLDGKTINWSNLCLLSEAAKGQFKISLIPTEAPFQTSPVYRVSNQMNIVPCSKEGEYFVHTIDIKKNWDTGDVFVTKGVVRTLIYTESGDVAEYKIGVFSQKNKHYLGIERSWLSKFGHDKNGNPALQGVEWPQLISYLQGDLNLKPCSAIVDPIRPRTPTRDLSDGEGEVMWFSANAGTGAILTSNGLAKVHYSQIISTEKPGPVFLVNGQRVHAKTEPVAPGNEQHTEFKLMAKEVRVQV